MPCSRPRLASAAMPALALLATCLPAPAYAGEPTMALADVRAGMQCTALSVVQGTEPVAFDATVLGIEGGPRPSDSLIVMRFSGAAIAGTGIGQGFSGSPVWCPDAAGVSRVVGAISQGIGQYDNLVGGVTPIEAMLGTPTFANGPTAPTIGEPSTSKTPTTTSKSAAAKAKAKKARAKKAKRTATSASATAQPWGTGRAPLTLTGVRGPLASRLARVSTKAGLPMFVGPTASRAADAPAAGPLVGGSAVAVSQVTGDVNAGAIGTVTYVDGDRVWLFGHPYNGNGAARMMLQQASITTVIGSPAIADQVSYKLGTPGAAVGTVGFDGAFAVGGVLGPLPATIPTDVTVRNAAGAIVQTATTSVTDERAVRGGSTAGLLPLAAGANAGAALQRLTSQAVIGGSAHACTTIFLKGQKVPLYQCADTVVPTADASVGGIESGVAEAVAGAVTPAVSAERFLKLIDRVNVDVRLRDEADTAQIVRVRQPKKLKAGTVATVRVVVIQGSTGERREVPIQVRIPKAAAGLRTGIAVLADPVEVTSDASFSDALFGDDEDSPAPPKNLSALRALYTPSGLSGLRAVAVPGVPGDEILAAFAGDETDLSDEEITELQRRVKVAKELPTVTVTGSASVNVRPSW
ncbi:MAG: hypothetical protein J7513_18665 [Solirubrobacteraceae bacterium]|nr:hypothetical protein [Solirubrobacteraceae bacterium]